MSFIGTLSHTLTLRVLVLIPPSPFQGGDQGLRAFHRREAATARQLRQASDDALLDDLFGAEEEQDKAQEHKQQVERLGTEIFLVKDDGAENEGNEDAAAPYH